MLLHGKRLACMGACGGRTEKTQSLLMWLITSGKPSMQV
jgi:hypothetical protein